MSRAQTCPAWSAPARVEKTDAAARQNVPTVLESLRGGRWSACVATLRAGSAWSGAAHAVRLVAVNGSSETPLAVAADALAWSAADGAGNRTATITLAGVPADGFRLEVTPTGTDLSGALVVLEARAALDAPEAIGSAAEQLGETLTARQAPALAVVLYGKGPSGELLPLAVDTSGALETA